MKAIIKSISFILIAALAVALTLIFRKSLNEKKIAPETPPAPMAETNL